MSKKLVMKFKDAAGESKSLTVTDVKEGITQTDAEALMDTIIAKDIFIFGPDVLSAKDSALIVETTETALFDNEL